MVKNLPVDIGDTGSIPGPGISSHAAGQLNLRSAATEPAPWSPRATVSETWGRQQGKRLQREACTPQ